MQLKPNDLSSAAMPTPNCDSMTLRDRFWNFVGHFDPFAKGALTQRDLRRHPIWEYATNSEGLPWRDETWRRPLKCAAIPWEECSLAVAATLMIRSGQRFDGDACVSTLNGIVDVPTGGICVNDVWYFIPMNHPQQSEAHEELATAIGTFDDEADIHESMVEAQEKLATAIGLSVDEIFPIRWKLNVLLEGEVEMRTGEFRGHPIEP